MTRTRRPRRRQRDIPVPPTGLRAMFSLLVTEGLKPVAATNAVQAVYPHARRVVDTLLATSDEGVLVDELEQATFSMYPNLEAPPATTTAQEAAFNVGFAVCWLLMTAVNGRDGAR